MPVPCGSTAEPLTFWSAWRVSTPSGRCTSIAPSNFDVEHFSTSRTASSGSYCWLRSIALATSSYLFPRCFGTLARHLDSPRASGALDHLHGCLDVVGVHVLELELSDLAHLLAVRSCDLFPLWFP